MYNKVYSDRSELDLSETYADPSSNDIGAKLLFFVVEKSKSQKLKLKIL